MSGWPFTRSVTGWPWSNATTTDQTETTTEADAESEDPSDDTEQLSPLHDNHRLYRIRPDYSFRDATSPSKVPQLPRYISQAAKMDSFYLLINLRDDKIKYRAYTTLTADALAQVVGQADQTTAIGSDTTTPTIDRSLEYTLSVCEPGLRADVESRSFEYYWDSPKQFPFGGQTFPLPRVIKRLRQVQWPLMLIIYVPSDTHSINGREEYSLLPAIRFTIPEDIDTATFGTIENQLNSVFAEMSLTAKLREKEPQFPAHVVTGNTLRSLTSQPSPSETHQLGLSGTSAPINASNMERPRAYYNSAWSLGKPVDDTGQRGNTAVGYGTERFPVTTLRVAPSKHDSAWTDTPPRAGFLNDIRQLATQDGPLFIIDTRENKFHYGAALADEDGLGEAVTPTYHPGRRFTPTFHNRTDEAFAINLVNYLQRKIRKSSGNYIIDLSETEYPAMDATTFVNALDYAIRELPELRRNQYCSVAIDDAISVLQYTAFDSLSQIPSLVQGANMTLQCRYPVGTVATNTRPSSNRTTAQQVDIVENLITTGTDGILLQNSQKIWSLLRKIGIQANLAKQLQTYARTLQHNEWIWIDRTAPTKLQIVTGLAPYRESHELPYLARSGKYEIDHIAFSTIYDDESGLINWDRYAPQSVKQDSDTSQSTSDTTQSTETTTYSGKPKSRIAKPRQTTDSALPPGAIFDSESETYQCTECGHRYEPAQSGLASACQCCSKTQSDVDRDTLRAVPPLNIKRSPAEIDDSPCSRDQLIFLRACYLAKQFAFDPVFQFDPLTDSMQHIQEDLGIAADAIEELTALTVNGNGVLTKQATTTPHTVYNVTAT